MTDFIPRFDTLVDVFERSTAQFADQPLFGTKTKGNWSWMSYGEFRREVDRVRSGLASLGVVKGDAVAIIADNCSEWAIAAYAAYGLGAAVVPMYEAQTDDNWRYILGDSGVKVAFTANNGIAERVSVFAAELGSLAHVVTFDRDAHGAISFAELGTDSAASAPVAKVTGDDTAGFVYTSGTTGNPKGVLLSHANLAHNVSAVTDVFPMTPEDRTLSFLPWAHAFGQTVELHGIFSTGSSTAFAESTAKIMANLSEVRPTMLVSVPRIFTRIYDGLHKRMAEEGGLSKFMFDQALTNAHRRQSLEAEGRSSMLVDLQHRLYDALVFAKVREGFGGRLKYAIAGGAALPGEVAEFIDALGIAVDQGYGLSETSPIVTTNWPGSRKLGSVGRPIPGVRVELDQSATADEEDSGEIIVHGHNVMQGYHNLPEENDAVFTQDGGFRTGDLGRLDDDGFLYIIGRVKEQYKLANGKYVVPTLIEEKISLSPYVANAMVYGDNRPYNVALVVLDLPAVKAWATAQGIADDADFTEDERVRALIAGEIKAQTTDIARYELIRDFALLSEDFTTENGLLTPTLKIKRRAVLERFGNELEALYASDES